ncbi:hypothetical protein TEA_000302 [Camellia sinensis var. sinensis]|uniref:Protein DETOXIFICATION n=1 Tax=Camellia sinensis var. sinensis TaxID=542762 RepID=A0A4S4EXB2_CAMSN|nr:hypothetical protein TEA_000302 [Camellia sinensis var. sinensis]
MGSALDTFCGQSYGAKQYHMLGIHKQRAMLVLLLVSIPLACIWANAGHILVFLGQDPEISAEAGSYARFMIPSIFAYALLQCHVRFLQTQNNVFPMMLSSGFTTLLHVLICWILVFKSGLGNKGAALANAISYWINVILLAIYVRVSPSCKNTWTGFSKDALHDIPNFLRLAIPFALMVCLEIWSFEMMVLLSGLLPNPKLETYVLSIKLVPQFVYHGLHDTPRIQRCHKVGMGSALDTFCGQSYGAKQYHMLGHILVFLGQDPEISAEAGSYARFMIPSIFAYALLQCHVRFLQTQNNVFPMMLSSGFTTLLHVLICWILVFKSGLGNKGAALANAISYWINVILLAIYVRVSPSCKNTWTGFSKEALHDIPKFLRLAIPSALMLCLEIWSFEMMVLLSGLLPNPKLETSVLSISLNSHSMVYMIPLGFSGATSIRVSNELGAGRPQAARLAICIALSLVVTEGILVATIMILGRKFWGYCYSTEEMVVRYVAEMMILLSGSHFVDGIQSVLSGIARGCGWQKIGAFANLGAYYLIGIPVGVLLAFVYHIGGKANKASDRVYGPMIPVEASLIN